MSGCILIRETAVLAGKVDWKKQRGGCRIGGRCSGALYKNAVFMALQGDWGKGQCLDVFVCGCLRLGGHGFSFLSILVVFVGVGSRLTCAHKTHPACASDVGSAPHLLDYEEAVSKHHLRAEKVTH